MYKAKKSFLKILTFIVGLSVLLFQEFAMAAKDLSSIASGLTSQIQSIASLLIIVSYVAGVGFALAGIIQFKAHKDNPTQVALSKPIVYLIVGACLLFLPTVISSSGQTIFGGSQESAGAFSGVVE